MKAMMKKIPALIFMFLVCSISFVSATTESEMYVEANLPAVETGTASDGSETWEYDPAYGYFDITKTVMPNSPEPGVEELRIRDYGNPETTLNFNFGDGIFVRLFTVINSKKTTAGRTISTDARNNFYFMTVSSRDLAIGDIIDSDHPGELIQGGMLAKKFMGVRPALGFCYFGYDTGGQKIPVCGHEGDSIEQPLYIYIVTEVFDKAWCSFNPSDSIMGASKNYPKNL